MNTGDIYSAIYRSVVRSRVPAWAARAHHAGYVMDPMIDDKDLRTHERHEYF